MSEDTTPNIKPLTEEEIIELTKKIEESGDFDSDLSRALFTILVSGYEYHTLYTTLQAYYAASAQACFDLSNECAKVIGLRDLKKIQKMNKIAGTIAGLIPQRAADLLKNNQEENNETTEGENNE
jgi:hypothetical protein